MAKNSAYRVLVADRVALKPKKAPTAPLSKKFVAHNSKLHYDVEYAVRRIIEGEIEMQGLLEGARLYLHQRFDFKLVDLFMAV